MSQHSGSVCSVEEVPHLARVQGEDDKGLAAGVLAAAQDIHTLLLLNSSSPINKTRKKSSILVPVGLRTGPRRTPAREGSAQEN